MTRHRAVQVWWVATMVVGATTAMVAPTSGLVILLLVALAGLAAQVTP